MNLLDLNYRPNLNYVNDNKKLSKIVKSFYVIIIGKLLLIYSSNCKHTNSFILIKMQYTRRQNI